MSPKRPLVTSDAARGFEVFQWPEYLAFARRLGIGTETVPTAELVIVIPAGGVVQVTQKYHGRDHDPEA